MIDYIHTRMLTWADWVARGRRITGLGYPTRSAFYNTPSGGGLMTPIVDEHAWLLEKAIQALDPYLRETVAQFYLHAGTVDTHAKVLRCSRDTVYARLHRAHQRIDAWLQDERKLCATG